MGGRVFFIWLWVIMVVGEFVPANFFHHIFIVKLFFGGAKLKKQQPQEKKKKNRSLKKSQRAFLLRLLPTFQIKISRGLYLVKNH